MQVKAEDRLLMLLCFECRKERKQILEHVVDEPDDITVPFVK
jgi:hypothetical protein